MDNQRIAWGKIFDKYQLVAECVENSEKFDKINHDAFRSMYNYKR